MEFCKKKKELPQFLGIGGQIIKGLYDVRMSRQLNKNSGELNN